MFFHPLRHRQPGIHALSGLDRLLIGVGRGFALRRSLPFEIAAALFRFLMPGAALMWILSSSWRELFQVRIDHGLDGELFDTESYFKFGSTIRLVRSHQSACSCFGANLGSARAWACCSEYKLAISEFGCLVR